MEKNEATKVTASTSTEDASKKKRKKKPQKKQNNTDSTAVDTAVQKNGNNQVLNTSPTENDPLFTNQNTLMEQQEQQAKKKRKPRSKSKKKKEEENKTNEGEEREDNEKQKGDKNVNNNKEDEKRRKLIEKRKLHKKKKREANIKKAEEASALQSNQQDDQTTEKQSNKQVSSSPSNSTTINNHPTKKNEDANQQHHDEFVDKENKPVKKNFAFSFNRRRQRNIDASVLPLEEIQYGDLSHFESKKEKQSSTILSNHDELKREKSSSTPSSSTTTKSTSMASLALSQKGKKKLLLSSEPILDPKYSLSNYFVPATKSNTEENTSPESKHPETKNNNESNNKKDHQMDTNSNVAAADSKHTSKDFKDKLKESKESKESKSIAKDPRVIPRESKSKSREPKVVPKESKSKSKEPKSKSKDPDQHQPIKSESKNNRSIKIIMEKKDDGDHKKNEQSKKKERKHETKNQQKENKKAPPAKYVHPDDRLSGRRPRYPPYLDPEIIQKELDDDTIYQGLLRINKRNRSDSFVTSDELEHDIYIEGLRDRNRALEGDLVAVRLLDVDTIWQRKKDKQQQKNNNKNDDGKNHDNNNDKDQSNVGIEVGVEQMEKVDDHDSDDDEDNVDKNKPKYCGQVVGILHRIEKQQITGTLHIKRPMGKSNDNKQNNNNSNNNNNDDDNDDEDNSDGDNQHQLGDVEAEEKFELTPNYNHVKLVWFKPTDKRAPFIAIPVSQAPEDFLKNEAKYKDEIFVGQYVRWPIDSQYPFGKLVRELGPIGDMNVEAQSILADSNIYDGSFSNKALKCLPTTPWKIPKKEYEIRRDLRDHRVFSIDPETAKDLDDALHVIKLDDGNFEVGVHIADVSFFLKRFSQLDHEAKDRGTSTYLVERVIPMLPSLLCEELCSLNPNVERLAFSVIWKMDEFGNILDTWFGRTIIKSCAKLAYQDAQNIIEGNGLPLNAKVMNHSIKSVEEDIMNLYNLSLHMRKRRFNNGALSMNSIRLTFKLDDNGEPIGVGVYEQKDSNRLIEEFMLRANISVAEKICEHYPKEALLRRHEYPIPRRLAEFIETVEEMGYKIDGSSSGTLQESFNAIESADVKTVLLLLAIKPMKRAKYFCSGSFDDIAKYLHYALNIPMYTHFTSPIRRYADIVVHRQLEAILKKERRSGYTKKSVQAIALQCNRTKDHAKLAQERSSQLYLSRYLHRLTQTDGPVIRSAIVLQVGPEAFDILVPDYGLESRVYMDTIPFENFIYHPQVSALYVYWKKDGVVNMDNVLAIREQNKDKFNQDKENNNDDNDTTTTTDNKNNKNELLLSSNKNLLDNLPKCKLDETTRSQQFKTFERFDVLIQVNMERTPPFINIYPVNPFYNK
ncbi:unnamed protein product [Cunninghamella blakesleeana]